MTILNPQLAFPISKGYNDDFQMMNFPKLKRRIIHIFFLGLISVSIAAPSYAVTADLVSSNQQEVIPVTKQIALTSPKPIEKLEVMGPEKPEHISLITPTPPISLTDTPTPSPTATPTPTPTPLISPLTQIPPNSSGGLNPDILFNMSNEYRARLGLSTFQKDDRICALAAARAPQIGAEIAEGHMHSGKNNHNFPYWFTENIITMRSEAEAFNWWINDHIHRVQIEEPNTHSCVACQGSACVQHFTSFKPK